jgi:hypothetical protein
MPIPVAEVRPTSSGLIELCLKRIGLKAKVIPLPQSPNPKEKLAELNRRA